MKKRIAVFNVLLIILCLCSCGAKPVDINDTAAIVQGESISDKLINDIENEYEEESKKDEYLTTSGMIELAHIYADKWDEVSAEYYNKIIASSGDKKDVFKEKLDEMKASYEEYTESNMDMHREIYSLRYSGGSIIGPLCATKYYELRKGYALALVGIYEEMTFDMK